MTLASLPTFLSATDGSVSSNRMRARTLPPPHPVAVCSHWRAAATVASPRGRALLDPRFHPCRWMLFLEGFGRFLGHRALGGHACFFDLSAARPIVRVPLPKLKDHCILDSPDGLLLLQRNGNNVVRLLHPFTRQVAEFADLKCLAHQLSGHCQLYEMDHELIVTPWYNFNSWLQNTALCLYQARKLCVAVSVTATGGITVMLALHSIGRVAFASAGYAEWTVNSWKMNQLDRTLSFQGKLYVVNWEDGLTHATTSSGRESTVVCNGHGVMEVEVTLCFLFFIIFKVGGKGWQANPGRCRHGRRLR